MNTLLSAVKIDDKVVRIVVNDRQLREVGEDAVKALLAANDPPTLFQRGTILTRVRLRDEAPSLQAMSDKMLQGRLAQVANWFRRSSKKYVAVAPPMEVVSYVQNLPEWPDIPVLKALIEAPTFTKDGDLITAPGYHPKARLWLHCPTDLYKPVSLEPTNEEVAAARDLLLNDLLGDFPFVDDASRAHALAAMLLPFARDLIDGPTLLHAIDAPTPGTGKSLLAKIIAIPATGHGPNVMTEARDEDEWRKRITAVLVKSPVFTLIDNVGQRLGSVQLSGVLTAEVWEDRILGLSRTAVVPVRCVWLATGNNMSMSTEVARRVAPIRLDAELEMPWHRRGFRHPNLPAWAIENRGRLVLACLTLVQAWISRGRPLSTLEGPGSYERWTAVMGGILEVAGVPGFVANADTFYQVADQESAEWREFLAAWEERFGGQRVGVQDLYLWLVGTDGLLPEFLGDGSTRSQRTKFGLALRARRDRIIGRWRIRSAGEDHSHRQLYQLERLSEAERRPADLSRPSRHPSSAEISLDLDRGEKVCEVSEVCS